MIRINLLQTKKRSRSRSAPVDGAEKRGAIYVFSLMALVGAVALILYFALDSLQEDTKRVQQKTNEVREKVEQIKKLIDEETLAARRAELDRIRAAKEKVESQRRSPVQVMHELANILTTGISPDYIEEDYRQCQNRDPECALDPSWDGQAIWLESVSERQGGLLEIHGYARDAADLSEFVKRMRVSARFHDVTHPKFNSQRAGQADKASNLEFTMTARVVYWD